MNLHPTAPSFSTALPGLRIRGFARDAKGTLHEAPMNLDTLLVDLDKEALESSRGAAMCRWPRSTLPMSARC